MRTARFALGDAHGNTLLGIFNAESEGAPVRVTLDYFVDGAGGSYELPEPVIPVRSSHLYTVSEFPLPSWRWETGNWRFKRNARWPPATSRVPVSGSAKLTGRERAELKAGFFDALRLEVEPLDGQPGGGTYSIDIEEPRLLVRSTTRLPPHNGRRLRRRPGGCAHS